MGMLSSASTLADENSAAVPLDAPLNANRDINSATQSTRHTSTLAISESQARSSIQWLAELAIRKSPRTYSGDKDWGDTKTIRTGIKLRREGLRLKTNSRKKELRHGRWIKYELTLPPPTPQNPSNPNGLVAKIHRVTKTGDLQVGTPNEEQTNAHWQIVSSVETPMEFSARVERWNLGVQWYSLSVKGKMRVRLDSTVALAFLADYSEVPPALVIDPKVTASKLDLIEFEVDRVSKIGGDAAEEWGEIMERVVRDVFLKKHNEKLTSKLNKSIGKNRDDLRLSMADWFATW